jgi:hypothetical protein
METIIMKEILKTNDGKESHRALGIVLFLMETIIMKEILKTNDGKECHVIRHAGTH